ncbi:MAG TPA: hypothetical protein VFH80_32420 [Solirubrobacteraceae bacterium]|nr:hypothetical protein [Solirubrobacteraceae bacterium]
MHWTRAGREPPPKTAVVPAARSHEALALQRVAGNRATRALLQRAVLTDEKLPMVRFTVGVEIGSSLAALAWSRTTSGALDDAALGELRQLALKTDETIDDDERMFIAALLDRRNAERLHAMLPQGFTEPDAEISFPVQWISAANRAKVRDFGRSVTSAFGGLTSTVRKALALADSARIPHADVNTAMIAAASDSTPGDRAFAAAVYVIARRARLDVADDLLVGRIKVDEVPAAYVGSGVAAKYQTAGSGRKGDTVYLPSGFDVDDIEQQGTIVHELTHAAEDKSASGVRTSDADRSELSAFRAQARFYLRSLSELSGPARERTIDAVAAAAGEVRIYTLVLEANVAPIEDYDEFMSIIGQINAKSGALGSRDWNRAIKASNAELEPLALAAIRRLYHLRRGDRGQWDGLSGESVLDWRSR